MTHHCSCGLCGPIDRDDAVAVPEPGSLLDQLCIAARAVDQWPAWKREMLRRDEEAEKWFAGHGGRR